MKDNEYTRKEKICHLIDDYCNEEHKNCDRFVAVEVPGSVYSAT